MNLAPRHRLGALPSARFLALAFAAAVCVSSPATAAESPWAHLGSNGRLVYRSFTAGDHIMDFSYAGYLGGGVRLPNIPAKMTIAPSGGDDTAAIQKDLDLVSQMPLSQGFRGAVLLTPGTFNCGSTLVIKAAGVVLRGSGSGSNGTTINMTGSPHLCISVVGDSNPRLAGSPSVMTDAYVPSGTFSFHVKDASSFKPGDTVIINRPATPAWVRFMGMDTLVRAGRREHWVSGEMQTERTIAAVSRSLITLNVPLSDSFDSRYLNPPGGSIVKCDLSERPTQIGIEHLHIYASPLSVTINQPLNRAVRMEGVSDSWIRDLEVDNTANTIYCGSHTSRITIDTVNIHHAVATIGAAKPEDFWAGGTQTLVNRCTAAGNNVFYFSTGPRMMGPVVVLNCVFRGNGHIQPHMRWATGLLVDNCRVPDSGIDLMDRGIMGSGHGWTVGWSVAWNCLARSYIIQQPPGSMNWAIGCCGAPLSSTQPGSPDGPELPQGIFDSPGVPVTPASLYLAQLKERLGSQALANLGY